MSVCEMARNWCGTLRHREVHFHHHCCCTKHTQSHTTAEDAELVPALGVLWLLPWGWVAWHTKMLSGSHVWKEAAAAAPCLISTPCVAPYCAVVE